ncbi:MAG: CDP-diacylglycerol--glycerol-3-phosphate 3-phosphatidyltransferase [Gammaproteobacteria bacterium]|nr:CDP-diacylglycerol--glycerol-3-phosphate 3-phosphatidyltransferase [Gammaproteobacteria bacterium]
MNLPTRITVSRLAMVPILVLVFYLPFENHQIVAAGVFTLAALTDWFDGYLARKLGQMTEFGAFLDPVADKLMVAVALVLLVEQHDTIMFTLAACVIVGREIVVSALREWMAELGARTSIRVNFVAKVKTVVQMLAIIALLALDPVINAGWMLALAYAMLYAAALLTLWSMVIYLKAAWKVILEREQAPESSGQGDDAAL